MTHIKRDIHTNRVLHQCTAPSLRRANLEGANLYGANLEGANLRRANLRRADLRRADLRRADLYRADLRWANLEGADLEGAGLRWANLYRADLRWADLRWANLDFSVWPLWCGSFDVAIDQNQFAQLVYHLCRVKCEGMENIQRVLKPTANRWTGIEKHELDEV